MATATTRTTVPEVRILSKHVIKPTPRPNEESPLIIHLTPWDQILLTVDYIQKGLLFRKPQNNQEDIIAKLKYSFGLALNHFFPLAGRLVVTNHSNTITSPSISISIECNDRGAEFIHAAAPEVTVADIVKPLYIPSVVLSFFTLNAVPSIDGCTLPLLAVQVTELMDGFFIGMSINHPAADGTCFWHFFNKWSEICRTGIETIKNPPVLDRWFVDSCKPPIKLPFSTELEFVSRYPRPKITECYFEFSAESVASLKAKANQEMGTERISSLQSLLAHLWRCVTRARRLEPNDEVVYSFLIGCRSRLTPPMPAEYLGNAVFIGKALAKAGELLENGLGWAAWTLNQMVASFTEDAVRKNLEEWEQKPFFAYIQRVKPGELVTGSSPRFDVYGNDFGWGKPVTVRSGCGNKGDGKATIFPGPEKGSMALELSLLPDVLSLLVDDPEFMELVRKN
uniref:HXXXD-type acyl-transferase family protein n=1 Tax=Tradescantia hirsutiflora TaxID=428262 RepID=A0A1B1X422_9LILI|nr:HXXXD-type acyl-transferase family protein [Tradescantia hirsutiflora]